VVTVLFADVVGFTPLSQDRDPEHVKNLLDRCFDRLAAEISAYGGRVDKIVGDEIMAVFGAPVAHEDDPERAVRAALQMQRNLLEHAEETGADVRMRIGVNTGEVLVGGLRAGGDVTALGDVVNVAKRLQTSAEPGQVLVGHDTYDATERVIGYEEVGALTLKGREGLVEAWRAVETLGPPGTRVGRARTPLVGRKSELAMLWHTLGTTVDHQRPHLVLLVGEAGMGKTVLVEEAVEMARVQHDALVIEGRCLPYGEANPWWPIAEALRQSCGIDPEDPADVAAIKCRKAIGALVGSDDEGVEASRVSDALLYLMGYEGKLHDLDPTRAREEVTRAIQMSLAANARQRPLVIVLSELHWADQLVLDLIDSMFDRLRNLPIVLLATARPDLEDRWSPKPGRHNLFVVNLDPLNRLESADYVRKLLGTEPSTELIDFICERSGGNPLYISELIAMIGESGSVGVLAQRMDGAELPATLRGLVAARLDGLERADRSLLEDASVVGRIGPIGALKELSKARGEAEPHVRLLSLSHKDFLVLDEAEYEFRSDLVRDVAYETLTKGARATRHSAVADWLVSYASRTEREDEHLERIAHHYAQAAALAREVGAVGGVPSDILERAIEWIERAAARAESRETTAVSLHLMEHALELIDDSSPELRARFLVGRAKGRAAAREIEGALEDTAEVMAIGESSGDHRLCAQALTVKGEIEQRAGDLADSSETLQKAVELWQQTGDRQGEAEALRLWGFTSIHRGHLDEAETAITEALNISRQLEDRRGEAWALQNLAWAAFSRGDNDLAEERLVVAGRMFKEIGDFGGQGWATGLLAYVWMFKGRLEDAGRIAEGALDWTRETGDRWAYGMMLNLLSAVRMWQGRTLESREYARQSNRLFAEIDDVMGLSFSAVNLAWAAVLTGERNEGLELVLRFVTSASAAFAGGFAGLLAASNLHALVGDTATAVRLLDENTGPDLANETDLYMARAFAEFVAGNGKNAYEAARLGWDEDPQDPGDRANYACILSLAAAAAGHPTEAIDAGDEVIEIGGSYLDKIRAHLGRTFGHTQLEQSDQSARALESALQIADGTDDDVHKNLVRLAAATIATTVGDDYAPEAEPINVVRDRLEALSIDWRTWENAFRNATTAAASDVVASVD
jgi:class 3 adenylate cyclase/tetratricopeptide (TPR) repeat protein